MCEPASGQLLTLVAKCSRVFRITKKLLLTYVTFRTSDSTKVGSINHIAKKLDHYFLADNMFLFTDFQLVKVQLISVNLL